MRFEDAQKLLQMGAKVTRTSWADQNMFLQLGDDGKVHLHGLLSKPLKNPPLADEVLASDWEIVRVKGGDDEQREERAKDPPAGNKET